MKDGILKIQTVSIIYLLFLGINIKDNKKYCFIQVITNDKSYYIKYDFNDFKYNTSPFAIKIGNNFFSKENVYIDIYDKLSGFKIKGNLYYTNMHELKKTTLSPNIMGPFCYIPFMECNHAILSMKHSIHGSLKINDTNIFFNDGYGYIEKDWGTSFPKSYLWCQANNFKNKNCSLFFSIANIPFKLFNFMGFICVLKINNKEYKFTTYNNSAIKKILITKKLVKIVLSRKTYTLIIKGNRKDSLKLLAPINGDMKRNIFESINSNISIILKENNKIIYRDKSNNCGLEIAN